jgi:hypothetical protein
MMSLAVWLLASALQPSEKGERPAPKPSGFFRNDAVDFWGDKAAQAKRKAEQEKPPVQESIWAEPTKLADGRTSLYVPPKAVLQFLDDPSKETAKEYVAWQEERMKRLKAAMEILRDLQAEREAKASPPVEAPPAPATGEILYFKKHGCPWCAQEDEVLAPLLRARPAVRIRTVLIEESPDLAQAYGVTVVPTLILPGKSGKSLALRGFMTEPQILSALQEVNRESK